MDSIKLCFKGVILPSLWFKRMSDQFCSRLQKDEYCKPWFKFRCEHGSGWIKTFSQCVMEACRLLADANLLRSKKKKKRRENSFELSCQKRRQKGVYSSFVERYKGGKNRALVSKETRENPLSSRVEKRWKKRCLELSCRRRRRTYLTVIAVQNRAVVLCRSVTEKNIITAFVIK